MGHAHLPSPFIRPWRVTLGLVGVVLTVLVTAVGVPAQPAASDDCPTTAAAIHGWGAPNRADDFNDSSSLTAWRLYDGPGHAGNGRRTPSAVSVAGGVLTITGDAEGNSEGMAWNPGQMYGRWEACVRSSAAAATYHSLLLLWPDAEDWPSGGEVDFMEILDPDRQNVEANLHYGPDDQQMGGNMRMDATQWHSWAVEWTPEHIATYVDGMQWGGSTDVTRLPPGPMHLCIQLDNFGGDTSKGGQEIVDWARQYPLSRDSVASRVDAGTLMWTNKPS
jgi:Glycosyl hydrolases family 16